MATFGPSNPTKDAGIWEQFATSNCGARTTHNVGHPFAGTQTRALLSWDVSTILANQAAVPGSTILVNSASLVVDTQSTTLTATQASAVYPLTRDYTQGTGNLAADGSGATWNVYNSAGEGATAWTAAGGDFDASFGSTYNAPTSDVDVTIDVTTAVQKALTDYTFGGLIGLLMKTTTGALGENKTWVCWSQNAGTAADRPTLTIDYTIVPPASTTQQTSGMLMVGCN